jgi:hypothetical protein
VNCACGPVFVGAGAGDRADPWKSRSGSCACASGCGGGTDLPGGLSTAQRGRRERDEIVERGGEERFGLRVAGDELGGALSTRQPRRGLPAVPPVRLAG